ncbi:MAG TPA: PPC domain-containing DNA-binding protein [Candidatus Saccharimonadia bacterium]
MTHAQLTENVHALCFAPGDDIIGELTAYCKEQAIANAQITGLGSVENPTLAHYTMATHQFAQKELDGTFEITALSGNIGLINDQPAPHLHVSLADADMHAFGGHLMAGVCGATLEVIVTAYPSQFTKSYNEQIGLNVWDFPSP